MLCDQNNNKKMRLRSAFFENIPHLIRIHMQWCDGNCFDYFYQWKAQFSLYLACDFKMKWSTYMRTNGINPFIPQVPAEWRTTFYWIKTNKWFWLYDLIKKNRKYKTLAEKRKNQFDFSNGNEQWYFIYKVIECSDGSVFRVLFSDCVVYDLINDANWLDLLSK